MSDLEIFRQETRSWLEANAPKSLRGVQASELNGVWGGKKWTFSSDDEKKWLMVVPNRGSLPTTVPTDPTIYRFYELINVYGTTFKALIHEEFGDGIMSAIDFKMDLQREPNPAGDRVSITMSGKFLPYKTY